VERVFTCRRLLKGARMHTLRPIPCPHRVLPQPSLTMYAQALNGRMSCVRPFTPRRLVLTMPMPSAPPLPRSSCLFLATCRIQASHRSCHRGTLHVRSGEMPPIVQPRTCDCAQPLPLIPSCSTCVAQTCGVLPLWLKPNASSSRDFHARSQGCTAQCWGSCWCSSTSSGGTRGIPTAR
jgi:hypothetical protein